MYVRRSEAMTRSTERPTMGTCTLQLTLDRDDGAVRPVGSRLEAEGAAGAQAVRVMVRPDLPAPARRAGNHLGPGDPRQLGGVEHGAPRRRHRAREREAHIEQDALAALLVPHDLDHAYV